MRGPRIIHVPQPGDEVRETQASLHSDLPESFDDEDVAPPQPHRVLRPRPSVQSKAQPNTSLKRSVHKEPPSARRKPFSVSLPEAPPPPAPEPAGPRRALLSAPPPPLAGGPTPLRPTPRFGQSMPPPIPEPASVVASTPAPEIPAVALPASEDDDDNLPAPGDPRLAPPEPKQ
jgi:hypothetical protein